MGCNCEDVLKLSGVEVDKILLWLRKRQVENEEEVERLVIVIALVNLHVSYALCGRYEQEPMQKGR